MKLFLLNPNNNLIKSIITLFCISFKYKIESIYLKHLVHSESSNEEIGQDPGEMEGVNKMFSFGNIGII